MAEPSKVNATYNSTVGGIKETVGNVLGATDTAVAGKQQKAGGDAEYKAAQAQGYAEGTKDRVGGKVDQVVGAVTGDSTQEASGKVQNAKGSAQQEVNKSV